MNEHTLRHFGLQATGEFDSKKAQSVRKKLFYNINQGKITLLTGRYESGKTMLVRQLKRQYRSKVNFIDVLSFDEEKLKMGTILKAVISELSTEGPRREISSRSKQAVRLLGNSLVNGQKPNCIILDNTPERIALNTMNALKLLMEAEYAGHSPLTSVIILCWPEFPDDIRARKDIEHRIQQVKLDEAHGWFTLPDRVKYLDDVFGSVITEEARRRVAALHSLPGDMNAYVVEKMEKAEKGGYNRLDDKVITPTLRERYEKMKALYGNDYSYGLIAREAKLGKSTVSVAIESEPERPSTQKVREAMDRIEEQLAAAGGSSSGQQSQRKAS